MKFISLLRRKTSKSKYSKRKRRSSNLISPSNKPIELIESIATKEQSQSIRTLPTISGDRSELSSSWQKPTKKAEKSLKETREIEVLVSERRNKMRYKRPPFERGTLEFEIDYVRRMCYIAGHKLWLDDDSLAIEEAYTTFILQILDWQREKTSIKTIMFEILHNITRKPSCYFWDLPDYYEPTTEDTPEAENNPYTLAICEKLKSLRWEENYEKALNYYRTVWRTWGKNKWWRDLEREREWAVIRSRKTKLIELCKTLRTEMSDVMSIDKVIDTIDQE